MGCATTGANEARATWAQKSGPSASASKISSAVQDRYAPTGRINSILSIDEMQAAKSE